MQRLRHKEDFAKPATDNRVCQHVRVLIKYGERNSTVRHSENPRINAHNENNLKIGDGKNHCAEGVYRKKHDSFGTNGIKAIVFFWRREGDSNPRTGISRYTISNRAP